MDSPRHNDSHWYWIAAVTLLAAAAAIRIPPLRFSLFEDEVWVAALLHRGDLHPHTYSIPILFYAIGRCWTSLRGFSDVALREPAALFGLFTPAVAFFAPRERRTRFLWAAMLAFSSPMLFYSGRLKQYTLEAFVTTCLIVLFLRASEHGARRTWVAFFILAGVGALGLFGPVILVAAAGCGALLTRNGRSMRILLSFAAIGVLAGVAYFGWAAPGPQTPMLHGDMDKFFTETGRWVTSPTLFASDSRHWIGESLNQVRFSWFLALVVVIVWIVVRRDWVVLSLALIPPLFVAGASMMHVYPYGEVRLMIFAFPAIYLMLADALSVVANRVPWAPLLLVPFILNGAAGDVYNRTYMRIYDLHPLYDALAASHRGGTLIHASTSFAAPLNYYHPELAPDLRVADVRAPAGPGWYLENASEFDASHASVAMKLGGAVAARFP